MYIEIKAHTYDNLIEIQVKGIWIQCTRAVIPDNSKLLHLFYYDRGIATLVYGRYNPTTREGVKLKYVKTGKITGYTEYTNGVYRR